MLICYFRLLLFLLLAGHQYVLQIQFNLKVTSVTVWNWSLKSCKCLKNTKFWRNWFFVAYVTLQMTSQEVASDRRMMIIDHNLIVLNQPHPTYFSHKSEAVHFSNSFQKCRSGLLSFYLIISSFFLFFLIFLLLL